MKNLLTVICLFILIFSCTKEKDVPTELPSPVKTFMEDSNNCGCAPYVDLYYWREQFVYILSCKGAACNCATIYYNEAGTTLTMADGYSFDRFKSEAKFQKNVWSCNHLAR